MIESQCGKKLLLNQKILWKVVASLNVAKEVIAVGWIIFHGLENTELVKG